MKRRSLLAAGAAYVVRRSVLGANNRIRVGVIGAGNRANLLIDQLPEDAEIVAIADCYLERANQAAAKRQAKWRIFQDFRKLLELKDVEGVIVATNEHWHVGCSAHACVAGKDVYVEKPLSLYIEEGRALVRIARKYDRVVQVGSQQRSMAMNKLACDFVRSGGLGRLAFVEATNYTGPRPPQPDLPARPIPETLDWDMWVGPAPMRPYNPRARGGWDFGGGEMTNWGAHGLDQVQSALGHMQEWLDCMRTRKKPSADVEIGHRSVTICHLANITRRLGRALRWNPETERFIDDEEANSMVSRPRRKGYELPV